MNAYRIGQGKCINCEKEGWMLIYALNTDEVYCLECIAHQEEQPGDLRVIVFSEAVI